MDFEKLFSSYSKIIVELGMGDGRMLESLAKKDSQKSAASSLYLGLEIKSELCEQARSRITLSNSYFNILIINGSFEEIILEFPDGSIDRFIAVLPDPSYIDEKKQEKWIPFYKIVYAKMKYGGTFQLVTEITDELLQPVSEREYFRWTGWLNSTFSSIGFSILNQHEGAPDGHSSSCLDQFKGDPERIRITTLEMQKK